jgi:hypothetical protein
MKTMKKLFLAAVTTITFQSTQSLAGGVSDGGGGTIIQNPVGTEYIANQLEHIRPSLLFFLKNTCVGATDACAGMNEGTSTIFDKIKTYSIDIQKNDSCYDFNGYKVDGSIRSKQGTICISAFTIGTKVNKDSAFPQLIALLAHEYSHLMGYDENQAHQFQLHCLQMLQYGASPAGGDLVAYEFTENSRQTIKLLSDAQRAIETQNLFAKAYYLVQQAGDNNLFPYISYFFPLDQKETIFVQNIRMRLYNLNLYGCATYELDAKEKADCDSKYNQIFAGADKLDAATFKERLNDNTSAIPNAQIMNLKNHPENFLSEIRKLQIELSYIRNVIDQQRQLRN